MTVLNWLIDHWELIVAILGWIASLLMKLGKDKYGKIITSIVGEIERIGPDARALTGRIKTVNTQQGTEAALKKIVTEVRDSNKVKAAKVG